MLKGFAIAGLMLTVSHSVFADEAQKALAKEAIECAAYYQISSEAIGALNAPQMQAVGERLKASKVEAETLAKKYQSEAEVTQAVADAKARQIQSLGGSSNLGVLMGKYKEECKNLLADPQKRLDYWTMATM
ncbi:hypothetical protein HRJ35_15785 [Shewanella oneidensis MR-1]|uniref:Periplasmic protein n=1 Tax=Shewanella oneidensis (strain ATCC 700550 / JCM 31522 / CIP 106686 / LMG 19005 / NCIMB 14063 / MR-1) TaxID=211586 RepID=Q8EDB4_SHEON|nr:hypothetical protein [Shewanella oneidensis]AAN55864.1 putative periplasmic protein [Shewanella oneidensis MR-1]MDX5995501.1 hypothetical protein [Shewanella oneidensis]MEE2029491.1 hypothetical protein [Shewanella oneidensis]QKG97321.1 hypothetical protein HRJ35_15785 [Shewanella oneidensis MR-1]